TSRLMPPNVEAAKASTSTPKRSRRLRTPAVAPLTANAKVPHRSSTSTRLRWNSSEPWSSAAIIAGSLHKPGMDPKCEAEQRLRGCPRLSHGAACRTVPVSPKGRAAMTLDSIAASPSPAANAAFVDRPGDFTSPSGYDYNDIAGVRGNPHVTQAFIDKVEAISARIGTKPEYLMAVMSFESAQTFSPDVVNRLSGATGLIQFIPPTAQGLGTSTYALSQMSAIEQLDYVEKYF